MKRCKTEIFFCSYALRKRPHADGVIKLYIILYTVSNQQHQYSDIMYVIGYTVALLHTLYHYIDVVVY